MNKGFNNIGGKVVLGFMALLVIAMLSLSYIYRTVEQVVAEDNVNSVPRQKIFLVTNTQSLLYESEAMGQLLNMEDEDVSYLNETFDKARRNMNELRLLVEDTLMLSRIDTIDILINRKRENTEALLQIWREAGTDLYAKNIEKELEQERKTVEEQSITESATVQKDTVVVQGRRRNFLQRLAEVFVPTGQDSSVIVSENLKLQSDTLVNAYDPNVEISRTLRNLQENVALEQIRLRELLVERSSALRYDNSMISAKINQILRDMEEDELNTSLTRLQARRDMLGQTSFIIGIIAFISFAVALFFLFFIGRDLSKSRFYRKQLEREKLLTEGLLNSREKLILTIGHDIRAPLSSIIGYIELMQRSFPDSKQRTYLTNMGGSANHILSLVNDLLDFQRLESGQMEIHAIPMRVPSLFDEIFKSFEPQAKAKDLELSLNIIDSSDLIYQGDTVRIRQIVGNLLSNALKFTHEGGVQLTIDCSRLAKNVSENDTAESLSRLKITVNDTGTGIPEAKQKLIFREFIRLEGAEKTEGFGLGLSITHKLVSLLGGEMLLESEEGKGSSFSVILPLPLAENQQMLNDHPQEEPVKDEELFVERPVTCLIVDDDLLQIFLMEEILKRCNVKVVSCTNPRSVLDLLKQTIVDAVLTDIQMPGMDGYDLLKQIRESDIAHVKDLPVVALSATVGRDQKRYVDQGFTAAIGKPFTSEELISLLNQVIPKEDDRASIPDFSSLTAFAGEDKEAEANILRTFSIETSRHISMLKDALASKDRILSAKVSHKLLPLFSMLGSTILCQQLKILERNDMELSDSGWERLLTDVISQIEPYIEQADSVLE